MLSLPIGLVFFTGVVIATMWGADLRNYLNMHSFIIVVLGSVAIYMIANTGEVAKNTIKSVFSLFKKRPSLEDVRGDLRKLAENLGSVQKSNDPLINYCISLWERGMDAHSFQALMSQYRDKLENEDIESISSLQHIAKYPPALGMLGTVMGMINLFANLGGSDKSGLGPALAVAMTATFYGLVVANGFIMPLADRLMVEALYRKKHYGLVYEILTLVNRREPVSMIEEEIEYREAA